MSNLFDKTTSALGSAINLRQTRQNVISSNIANAETPGYKAQKMDFENALARAVDLEGLGKMHADHPEHYLMGEGAISRVVADVYDNPEVSVNNSGNTVDLEKEMTALAENSVMHRAAIQLINKKLAAMRYAVTEGGSR